MKKEKIIILALLILTLSGVSFAQDFPFYQGINPNQPLSPGACIYKGSYTQMEAQYNPGQLGGDRTYIINYEYTYMGLVHGTPNSIRVMLDFAKGDDSEFNLQLDNNKQTYIQVDHLLFNPGPKLRITLVDEAGNIRVDEVKD